MKGGRTGSLLICIPLRKPLTRLYFPWHAIPSLSNPSLSSQLFSRSVANNTT